MAPIKSTYIEKKLWIISILSIALISAQCEKDDPKVDLPIDDNLTAVYDPTPYTLDLPMRFPPIFPQNFQLTKKGVELGRMLFYDPILSGDSTQTCASCHNQALAFTDNGRRFSIGIDGSVGTRNAMSLVNLAWRTAMFWDGRSPSVEHQALLPIKDPIEMHNTWINALDDLKKHPKYPDLFFEAFNTYNFDSTHVAEAIAQFELTLVSGNSKFDKYRRGELLLTPEEQLGLDIFNREPRSKENDPAGGDCFHCHNVMTNAPMTSIDFMNNGLDANPTSGRAAATGKTEDIGKFKVPTLRNVALTAPYMHDGRFQTLEAVIEHYASGVKQSPTIDPIMTKQNGLANGLLLTAAEKRALVAFLKTLTDEEFITNPAFSNPHL